MSKPSSDHSSGSHRTSHGLNPQTAYALTGMTIDQLWSRYAGLGGDRDPAELALHLATGTEWPAMEVNILAHVMNEHLVGHGLAPLATYRF